MMEASQRFMAPEGLHACVHCGLCLSACPTYLELGTEMDSPRGRIQLMAGLESGRLAVTPEVRTHLDRCLGCRACEPACPSGVPYGALIEAARPYVEARRPTLARSVRSVLVRLLSSRIGGRLLAAGRHVPARAALARLAPGMWSAYLGALPDAPRSAPLPDVLEAEGTERGTAVLLTGCVSEAIFAATNRAAALLLQRAGVRVVVLRDVCCGALFAHAGQAEEAHVHAAMLARSVPAEADWVVTTAAGCGAHLQGGDFGHAAGAGTRAIDSRARDALSLLAELGLPAPVHAIHATLAIHDPCHLVHGQGVRVEVRDLLATIPGIRLVDLAESDICCGSAGTYNLTERALARRLLERKLRHIEASGAHVVAAANPGCLLQIRAGAIKHGRAIAIEHPLDLLARAHGLDARGSNGVPRAGGGRHGRVGNPAC
jgi:glycolate oxidase iron-sulfur subunit